LTFIKASAVARVGEPLGGVPPDEDDLHSDVEYPAVHGAW
jgi:hypothetical protein